MTYQLFAIRFATNENRQRHENFIGLTPEDPHDAPMPMDFFVWVAVGQGRVVLIDTGCDEITCRLRGHTFLRCPTEGLRAIGIEASAVDTVVSTHLHWDHAGNFDKFLNAMFHASPVEVQHAVGPCMCNAFMRRPYDVEHVWQFVRLVYQDRVRFHRGSAEVAPGIWVHEVGGHAAGQLFVTVPTARGQVAIASDAMHYVDNLLQQRPFPVILDIPSYFAGMEKVRQQAESEAHIIPGHDPLVLRAYPPASADAVGLVVRLDVAPIDTSTLVITKVR